MPAVTSRNSLLMHAEYRIKLPDHDFPLAAGHKLTPSCRVLLQLSKDLNSSKPLSYDGPLIVNIRSAKHTKATAFIHAKDFDSMMKDSKFDEFTKENMKVKPIIFRLVDGGPDQNPRHKKVISAAIEQFKKYDLDVIIVATNAPGRSAFNPIERRMAPLSKSLAGVILPIATYGTHLNKSGDTIDEELELKNFKEAAEVAAKYWNDLKYKGYDTTAVYVEPEDSEIEQPREESEEWKSVHMRATKYSLHIVKCLNENCCSAFRSSWLQVTPERFLSAPIKVVHDETTKMLRPAFDEGQFVDTFRSEILRKSFFDEKIPFDKFCPSMKNTADKLQCATCGLFFVTKAMLQSHRKIHKKSLKRPAKQRATQYKKKKQNENSNPNVNVEICEDEENLYYEDEEYLYDEDEEQLSYEDEEHLEEILEADQDSVYVVSDGPLPLLEYDAIESIFENMMDDEETL
jgi:hypothetical protein